MEIAHEPGPDADQEHGTYKGLVDEVIDCGQLMQSIHAEHWHVG